MLINMIQHIVGPYMSSNYTSLRNRKNFQTSEGGHMVHFGHVLVFPNSVKNIDIQFYHFFYVQVMKIHFISQLICQP